MSPDVLSSRAITCTHTVYFITLTTRNRIHNSCSALKIDQWSMTVRAGWQKLACQRRQLNIPQCQRGARICKFSRQKNTIFYNCNVYNKNIIFNNCKRWQPCVIVDSTALALAALRQHYEYCPSIDSPALALADLRQHYESCASIDSPALALKALHQHHNHEITMNG